MKNKGAELSQEMHGLKLLTFKSQSMLSANELLPRNVRAFCFLVELSRSLTFVTSEHHKRLCHQPRDHYYFIDSSILLRLLYKGNRQAFSPFAYLGPPTPQFTCQETSRCNQSPFP